MNKLKYYMDKKNINIRSLASLLLTNNKYIIDIIYNKIRIDIYILTRICIILDARRCDIFGNIETIGDREF